MASDSEGRRSEVIAELRRCTSEKLMLSGANDALRVAERAYALATKLPKVPQPWPALAAYRLAHLMLRTKNVGFKRLYRVEELLQEAARAKVLGAVPRIYRLAVLDRLSRLSKGKNQIHLDDAFDQAMKHLADPVEEDPVIQNPEFNLLELAAYFLGRGASLPEGTSIRSDRLESLLHDDDWFLVGPDPVTAKVRMGEAIAHAELQARIEADPGGLWFVLAPAQTGSGPMEQYNSRRITPGDPQSRLLSCILQRTAREYADEVRIVTGDSGKDGNFRQILSRLRRTLGTPANLPSHETVVKGPDGLHRLADGIRAYGCIHRRTYESPT